MVTNAAIEGHDVWVVDPSLFTLPYDHELCQSLASQGHRVRLITRTLRQLEATLTPPRYDFSGLFYHLSEGRVLARSGRWIPRIVKGCEHVVGMMRLARMLRASTPDIVHFQWLPLPWVDRPALAAMARRCSLVLTVHDATAQGGRGFARLQRSGFFSTLKYFSRLVVHNETGRQALVESGVDAATIEILPHPPLPLPDGRAQPDLSSPVLMIFGEIKPYKGIDLAIEALAHLPDTHKKNVRLVIAGKAQMPLDGLKALAHDLGVTADIEWIDRYIPLRDLRTVLGSAAVFLLPYREADASGVFAQVLQLGRPIIASRTGVFSQFVGESGCGVLVEPGNSTELAEAIVRILDSPDHAARMGANARRLSRSMGSWHDMAVGLTDIYNRVRAERR